MITRMIHFDFSSYLDMGGPPKLKSNEKTKCIILCIEISSFEDLFTAEKVLHLFGALPPAASASKVACLASVA